MSIEDTVEADVEAPVNESGEYSEIILMPVGTNSSFELDVPNDVRSRIVAEIISGNSTTFRQLSVKTVHGSDQIWYNVKVVAIATSTPEVRESKRRWHANGEVAYDLTKRNVQDESGTRWDEP